MPVTEKVLAKYRILLRDITTKKSKTISIYNKEFKTLDEFYNFLKQKIEKGQK